ncbi:MAG: DUF192 domain-containing protein [Patescibacteria group bacterium]
MNGLLKVFIFAAIIAIFVSLIFYIVIFLFMPKNPSVEIKQKVCFKNYCFNIEVAKSKQELAFGLMFRKNLEKNNGMLFVFEKEGDYPFWMKNTLIPLDIIWIKENPSAGASTELSRMSSGQVVFINENSQPCALKDCPSIDPGVNASYVLEISAGMAKKLGLKKGDELKISP